MRLGRNFVVYLASSVIAGALPLALIPFLTRMLPPSGYGAMVTITTLAAFIGPLINWATTAFVGVEYFKTAPRDFPALLSTVMMLPLINTAILMLVFVLGQGLLSTWFDIPRSWVSVIPVMALLVYLPLMAQTILAMRDRAVAFAAIEISGGLINFGGTLALVFWLTMGWEGRVVAAIVASTTLSVIALTWFVRARFLTPKRDTKQLRAAFRFGVGGVAHDLATNALRLGDRLLIVALAGQAAVGTYAVAVQWTTIMLTVLSAFNRAWVPYLFKTLAEDTDAARARIVRLTYLIWLGLLGFYSLFSLVTPLGYHLLVDARYHASMPAAFWLSLGLFFNGIYLTVVDYLFYLKKTHVLACITGFNLALNMALAYFMIGVYGPTGAAVAFATTAFVVMCLTFVVSQRLYPMPWLGGASR